MKALKSHLVPFALTVGAVIVAMWLFPKLLAMVSKKTAPSA